MELRKLGSNQTELVFYSGLRILFSYGTPVAGFDPENCEWFRTDRKYSVTTLRHISKYLSELSTVVRPQASIDALVTGYQP